MDVLRNFRGDEAWVHAREDYPRGPSRAYWPGGASGVTLRPGVDLGYADPSLVEQFYRQVLTEREWRSVKASFGIKGEAARARAASDAGLRSINISYAQGQKLFPVVARPYWEAITRRFPELLDRRLIGEVHTVFLSLAFNRGPQNKDLEALRAPLLARDYKELARRVGAMQQNHRVVGIRNRRRLEAKLIESGAARKAPSPDPTPKDGPATGLQKMPSVARRYQDRLSARREEILKKREIR